MKWEEGWGGGSLLELGFLLDVVERFMHCQFCELKLQKRQVTWHPASEK